MYYRKELCVKLVTYQKLVQEELDSLTLTVKEL